MISTALQLFDVFESNLDLFTWFIDLLAKSLLLVMLISYLENNYARRISSTHRHKLWLIGIVLLGLLPVSSGFTEAVFRELLPDSNLSLITILVPANLTVTSDAAVKSTAPWLLMALIGYLSVLLFHISKLVLSFIRVYRIEQTTNYLYRTDVVTLLDKLRKDLGIARRVNIGSNESVCSPMTFGLRNPTVVLPDDYRYWHSSQLENVLVHELSHIKRHDWLAFIFAYVIASINWFNPFVWRALNRLSLEAELSCDNAVLKTGQSRREFAQQILSIAKRSLGLERNELLAQSITGHSDLTLRIENILYQRTHIQPVQSSFLLVSFSIALTVFILISGGNVFAIGDENDYPSESLRLVYSEDPTYPDAAFENGIKGYNQYSFTVDENGNISPQSIKLELSEPQYLFNASSRQALSSFRFKPRMVRGKAIATQGVKYTFHYN